MNFYLKKIKLKMSNNSYVYEDSQDYEIGTNEYGEKIHICKLCSSCSGTLLLIPHKFVCKYHFEYLQIHNSTKDVLWNGNTMCDLETEPKNNYEQKDVIKENWEMILAINEIIERNEVSFQSRVKIYPFWTDDSSFKSGENNFVENDTKK